MKLLYRNATLLLRTALLFGAMFLVGILTQAQRINPAERYVNPSSIIGDGNYYRVQFVSNDGPSYLTATGNNQVLMSAALDYNNDGQLWQFIAVNGGGFRMQSKNGFYVYGANNNANRFRFWATSNATDNRIVTLNFFARDNNNGYYFEIYRNGTTNGMNLNGGYQYTEIGEWNRNDLSNRLIINSLEYRKVTHRISYLYKNNKDYSSTPNLATQDYEYWDSEKDVQKVNEFMITHYVKQGTTIVAGFPTSWGDSE